MTAFALLSYGQNLFRRGVASVGIVCAVGFLLLVPALGQAASWVPQFVTIQERSDWQTAVYYESGHELYWYPEYAPIEKIVIHHTADFDGIADYEGRSGEELMRKMYQYHAVSRRWGDIGYNYVIAPDGTVYEGREGGENVIGAHVGGWNAGTVGIAIIGDYDKDALPEAVKESLVRLIANKVQQYGIDPKGNSAFVSWDGEEKSTPNIAGHSDYAQTSDPGRAVTSFLPTLRDRVASEIIIPANGEMVGKYYSNVDFSGRPGYTTVDNARLLYEAGTRSPGGDIPSSRYSVRWDGKATFHTTGYYTFSLEASNKIRLYVDGMQLVNVWDSYVTNHRSEAKVFLNAGDHDIRIDYAKGGHPGKIRLNWDASGLPRNAFMGEYYNNPYFAGMPSILRQDSNISFFLNDPDITTTLTNKYYSIQWQGIFSFNDGWYTVKTDVDGGVDVYIDDEKVVGAWDAQTPGKYWGHVQLDAGNHVVKVQYHNNDRVFPKIDVDWSAGKLDLPATPIPPTPSVSPTPTWEEGTGRWQAEYFNNNQLKATPVYRYAYDEIDFNWGTSAPHATLPSDNFSARFSTTLTVATRSLYTFTTRTDDGARLKIDDQIILEEWYAQGGVPHSVTVELAPGSYSLVLEYVEFGGGASCKLTWTSAAVATNTPTPIVSTTTGSATPVQTQIPGEATPTDTPAREGVFVGEYFDNQDLAGDPLYKREDDTINFDWGTGSPFDDMGVDEFSVRWTGTIAIPETGTYQFVTTTDDGVRLWVDEKLIIDAWEPQKLGSHSGAVRLTPGVYPVKMEYNEWNGSAFAKLHWRRIAQQSYFVGEYFANTYLGGVPVHVQSTEAIDFNWSLGSPHEDIPVDGFSVRWSGEISIPKDGDYAFVIKADDGVRLWIDDTLVMDKWDAQPGLVHKQVVSLSEGIHTLRLEYYEDGGAAEVDLSYGSKSSMDFTVEDTIPYDGPSERPYEAAWVAQTQPDNVDETDEYFHVAPGDTVEVVATFKNMGNTPWEATGEEEVSIAIYKDVNVQSGPPGSCYSDPDDACEGMGTFGASYFEHPQWHTEYRIAVLEEEQVAPGELGTFVLYFSIPSDAPEGKYREDITVAYGGAWMDNFTNGDEINKAHVWVGFIVDDDLLDESTATVTETVTATPTPSSTATATMTEVAVAIH